MSKGIYRASSVYPCPRHLSAVRLNIQGDPDPPYLEVAAREGRLHEGWLKDQLRAEGLRVEDGGTEPCPKCLEEFGDERFGLHVELTDDSLPFRIIGHTDGRVYDVAWWGLLECKSGSHFEYQRWLKEGFEGFGTYANQLSIYWAAEGATRAMYLFKNRSSGYIDRKVLESPPRDIKDILAHITEVEQWVLEHNTVMDAVYNPQSIECKRCPYARVLECVAEVTLQQPDEQELEGARKLWWKGKGMEEEGEKLQEQAKEVFAGHAVSNGLVGRTWRLKDIDVLRHHVNGRVSYPKAELLKVFTELELEPAKKVGESYTETRVTRVRDAQGE